MKKNRKIAARFRAFRVHVMKGEWGAVQFAARLPRVQARCFAMHQIRETAPGGLDEMPDLLGRYREEIRRGWENTIAI